MILSVSRRTDIPAFYSEWLLNRLREGYAFIPNPRNSSRYKCVELTPQVADCIVFWTKNPTPLLPKLHEVSAMGYPFYFQFTLTPYGLDMERNLPSKKTLLKIFQALSDLLGPKRVVWRYDPVILTDAMNIAYHLRCFEQIAAALEGYTHRCIFSFLDLYPKVKRFLSGTVTREIHETDMLRIAEGFSKIAQKHDVRLFTCCEPVDLSRFGVAHASCIDAGMIEDILGCSIRAKKDANQRPACGCAESVELGTYDCCPHGCIYCYATSSTKAIEKNIALHDPKSPVLIGRLPDMVSISQRRMNSVKDGQIRLF
jgi:hypothetical protein